MLIKSYFALFMDNLSLFFGRFMYAQATNGIIDQNVKPFPVTYAKGDVQIFRQCTIIVYCQNCQTNHSSLIPTKFVVVVLQHFGNLFYLLLFAFGNE